MSAISWIKSNIELNLLTIKLGYFLAKSVGMLFLSKRNIVMAELEDRKLINSNRLKNIKINIFVS